MLSWCPKQRAASLFGGFLDRAAWSEWELTAKKGKGIEVWAWVGGVQSLGVCVRDLLERQSRAGAPMRAGRPPAWLGWQGAGFQVLSKTLPRWGGWDLKERVLGRTRQGPYLS